MLQFDKICYLDGNGNLLTSEIKTELDEGFVKKIYRQLILVRTFDRKAISLQRQDRLGTYAPFEGQEAAQVGSAMALQKDDWLFPTYRDHAATITFGHSLTTVFLYWNGRIEGCIPPPDRKIFPPAVPIATQLPHATGAAMAEKFKGTSNAAIVYFGDGATSEGDFHEGLNFASVFKAPVVFLNQNNQYAISVPIERQMNSKTIAQKSVAYDIPGIRLDGNDVFAVYFETKKALERARKGEGPTLIEAVTWRYGAHTTADDPSKYRDQLKSDFIRDTEDPILRLEKYMKKAGMWDEQWSQQLHEEEAEKIEQAVKGMEAFPLPDTNDLFDHVFEENPWVIQDQKDQYFEFLRGVYT
ncbi:pyruvate dehydrogenase (acetyl-transferring) E1 component subunit alpha [Lederbergia citrea]|uniref:Pyruvate dehydrogenase E1 component subunit alpha n=1 Tax=Lederbergia citrea TaxID=2833581 RepID=A0A942UL08_9BACI|nr:pyruvate dehydrogenase (acetyl-transferring) E1 component subunit alpha [Lederbergia citrea]MBS4204238.1 pyruvate dehydrogenase (acetyl-transferring) E1 component subunit alpha [Lederbergia citrea]MBS4221177.1 pyruvate dehydrogenase (acetyl-transferring) E1 component subunit alpha [Lederbergia citrea]